MHRTVVSLALLAVPALAMAADVATVDPCPHDREALLALDEQAFDQDLSGGWRTLAETSNCQAQAADLIAAYRARHGNDSRMLLWHEAQARATAGQDAAAIALMERTRRPQDDPNFTWNPYVDATIAFLRRDAAALEQVRAQLAAIPPPPDQPLVNGRLELTFQDGVVRSIRWPPNIDVVEGFQACFDKPYYVAYSLECRPQPKPENHR